MTTIQINEAFDRIEDFLLVNRRTKPDGLMSAVICLQEAVGIEDDERIVIRERLVRLRDEFNQSPRMTGGVVLGLILAGLSEVPMKLWLDDLRPAPDGWIWVRTVDVAIELMKTGQVTEASLDHDLGTDAGGDELARGHKLVDWMAEHDIWPPDGISIHSANTPGVQRIAGVIERYGPYEGSHDRRSVRPRQP